MNKIVAITALFLLLSQTGTISAVTIAIELPELVGELQQYPNGSSAEFNFETSFLQIDEVSIQLNGTFTPGLAQGDGDELLEVPPEIEIYTDPGEGLCGVILHPVESPFTLDEAFQRWFGATWDFLLDGQGELTANLTWGSGWTIETPPTVELTDAYLTVQGTVPEPSTFVFFVLVGVVLCQKHRRFPR